MTLPLHRPAPASAGVRHSLAVPLCTASPLAAVGPAVPWVLVAALAALAVVLAVAVARSRRAAAATRRQTDRAERRTRLVVDAHEADRRRLAQVLHDGPVQDLLALGLGASLVYAGDDPFTDGDVDLRDVIRDLRAVSEGLRPPALDSFGLATALRAHVDRFQDENPGITADLDVDDSTSGGSRLPAHLRLALFRVAQEALGNAALHGPPLHVHVRLHLRPDRATLEVEDDGSGFDVPDDLEALAESGRYGILGIAGQAAAVDGRLHVESRPGRTLVRVDVPLA